MKIKINRYPKWPNMKLLSKIPVNQIQLLLPINTKYNLLIVYLIMKQKLKVLE